MNEVEFLGMFITAAVTLLGGIGLIVKPMSALTKALVEVRDELKVLNRDNARQDERLGHHDEKLSEHDVKIAELDVRTNRLECEHQRVHWEQKERRG